ncbi:hypothetical protein H4R33_000984 [Dimargaris cristalligena]|nr:hypothetical protein H4R33_000984 [Dimargaris cristalligena]
MVLSLAVPDAAVTAGTTTLTFRVTLTQEGSRPKGTDLVGLCVNNVTLVSPIYRTHQQVSWLHSQLTQMFMAGATQPPMALPCIPERLDPDSLDHKTAIERKRRQIDRYLRRLSSRAAIMNSPPMLHFLSENMCPTHTANDRPGYLSRLTLRRLNPKTTDVEFRKFDFSEPLEGIDQSRFITQQTYIAALQTHYHHTATRLDQLTRAQKDLSKQLSTTGDLALQALHSRHLLGGSTHRQFFLPHHKRFDRQTNTLAICLDDIRDLSIDQAEWQTNCLTDMLFEYAQQYNSVKTVVNHRTQKLMNYSSALNHCERALGQWERIQERQSCAAAEVHETIRDATAKLNEVKTELIASQNHTDTEIKVFEQNRTRDLLRTLQSLANRQLENERMQLNHLQSARHAVRVERLHPPSAPFSRTTSLGSTYSQGTTADLSSPSFSPRFTGRHSGSTLIEELTMGSGGGIGAGLGSATAEASMKFAYFTPPPTAAAMAAAPPHPRIMVTSAPTSPPYTPTQDFRPRTTSNMIVSERIPISSDPLSIPLRLT